MEWQYNCAVCDTPGTRRSPSHAGYPSVCRECVERVIADKFYNWGPQQRNILHTDNALSIRPELVAELRAKYPPPWGIWLTMLGCWATSRGTLARFRSEAQAREALPRWGQQAVAKIYVPLPDGSADAQGEPNDVAALARAIFDEWTEAESMQGAEGDPKRMPQARQATWMRRDLAEKRREAEAFALRIVARLGATT